MKYEKVMKEIMIQKHDFYNTYGHQPNSVIIEHNLYKQLEEYCKALVIPRTTKHITQLMGMKIYEVLEEKEIIKVCLM